MIYNNENEITLIYNGKVPIIEIYNGSILVWQAIRSCFGKGYWINEKPWDNNEGWKN